VPAKILAPHGSVSNAVLEHPRYSSAQGFLECKDGTFE